ncbi:hypothetical protein JOM49_006302 [Amycolatopsis magusensis]|uniref:Uncharacterized protein n=1 Tax=Amycolatopsis magusensis TaxID=882444 RepID=A0ABS4PZC3_9PSEU|nr:hypothetical protein [Amycolatopsis magusensis]
MTNRSRRSPEVVIGATGKDGQARHRRMAGLASRPRTAM